MERRDHVEEILSLIDAVLEEEEPKLEDLKETIEVLDEEEYRRELWSMVDQNGISAEAAAHLYFLYIRRRREIDKQ